MLVGGSSAQLRPTGAGRAVQALAWLALALMLARAVTLWAADPLLGYANNWDQVRTTAVFGLKPRDSGQEIHAGTPEQPWRFYIQAAPMGPPIYPSSDLLVKAVQVAAMKVFSGPDGVMDIKVAGAALLIGWLAGVLWVFVRLLARPAAALGFALWCCVVADPINLLFLNTLYAEFSAFMAATLLVGVLWLWLEKRLATRWTLLVGGTLVLFLGLHRNQWAYLGVALLPVALALAWVGRQRGGVFSRRAALGWALLAAVVCAAPVMMFQRPADDLMKLITSANRVNTVMHMLLPASEDPPAMLRAMKLPESCLAMSGKHWWAAPAAEFEANCPPIMRLPLMRIGRALAAEPQVMVPIIKTIALRYRGFVQGNLGQVEGQRLASISDSDNRARASFNEVIMWLAPGWVQALIWLSIVGPFVLAAAGLVAGRADGRRWAVVFAAQGLLFNYGWFSALFGDGYVDVERHASLCFSFGAWLPILLLAGVGARLLEGRPRAE